MHRLAVLVVAGLVGGVALVGTAHAQRRDDLAGMLDEVGRLHDQGKHAEALPIAERAVALARKSAGEDHPLFAFAVAWVAQIYRDQGRFAEAEPLYRRSLAILEKALGPVHPAVGGSLHNLAGLYLRQGRHAEAEPLYRRSLAIREKALGLDHPDVGTSLNNLAVLYQAQGRYAEAEPLYRRGVAIDEKALGQDHPAVGTSLNNLADLYEGQGRYAEAEPLYRRSLAIREKALGSDHPDVDSSLQKLAGLYGSQSRHAEAEPLYRRSLAIREKALGPDHPDVASSLNILAGLYFAQGRYAEPEPLYRRSLSIREKALGPDHPDVAQSLNNLARLYESQSRYAEAEPLYRRSLSVREKALGPAHLDVASSLNNLAGLYQGQGRYAEAEPLLRRSLAIREKALGPEHPDVGRSLNNLAEMNRNKGRYAEAEPLYRRTIAVFEKALGPDHPHVATVLNNLAELYQSQGRYAEAEPLHRRSLAIREKALGPDHPHVAVALNNLATLYESQSRYAEAEPLHRRTIAIFEKALGPDHPHVATSLNNLAGLYESQGRYAEAEPLHRRSLAVSEKALGPDHPRVATSLNNLAGLYQGQGRYAEAELLYRRSLAVSEKALGPDHPHVAHSLNSLALLYRAQGRYAEAEALHRRSLAIREKALGPDHPDVAQSLNSLALLYQGQGRYAEAEALHRRSLAIREKALGPDHPDVAQSLNNLAWLALARNEIALAAERWRRSGAVLQRRTERGLGGASEGTSKGEAQRYSSVFHGLVKTTHRLAAEIGGTAKKLGAEMFETAQWGAGSEAAASLAQMAARSATGSPELAALVRERQDLVGEWQAKDKLLITTKSEPPTRRNAAAETSLSDRLTAIDARLAAIDARLARHFPGYAALASSKPASVADVQASLRGDEALVLFLDMTDWTSVAGVSLPEETFVWVVTKSEVRWLRSELGTAALTREVAALRCGLDSTAWDGKGVARCTDLLKLPPGTVPRNGEPLPFDAARAHALYASLLGGAPDLIQGKHLIVVPSGALTTLPFQVLVSEEPASPDLAKARWLVRDHAITLLPSAASLVTLRRTGRPSAAPRPMIGFGNPLLDGPDAHFADRARLARSKRHCPETLGQWRVKVVAHHRAGVARVETRGGLANLAHLKAQVPLPETADELCYVAHDVKADFARDIHLGSRATEREVKRLSASGELAKYRMVHFATHGSLAGELKGTHEPGLVLTPPEVASDEDDGYLSASEIAGLKLDTDWVVLSACNTAAGGATNAEALSGLGRAFIYAGARTLLVSHWAVDSEAAVKIVTTAVREVAHDAKAGRAEALRRAMLTLIDKGTPEQAHPSYWAPFVVVGEGGR